jgi:heterodisulfide reductase subunit D
MREVCHRFPEYFCLLTIPGFGPDIPGIELVEMEQNRENALCCGTSPWTECSSCSKAIQIERLLEAQQTGAKKLITACPKCRIHLQ